MSGRAGYLGNSGVAVTKNPPYPLRVGSELAGPNCRQSATGLGVGNGDRLPLSMNLPRWAVFKLSERRRGREQAGVCGGQKAQLDGGGYVQC